MGSPAVNGLAPNNSPSTRTNKAPKKWNKFENLEKTSWKIFNQNKHGCKKNWKSCNRKIHQKNLPPEQTKLQKNETSLKILKNLQPEQTKLQKNWKILQQKNTPEKSSTRTNKAGKKRNKLKNLEKKNKLENLEK